MERCSSPPTMLALAVALLASAVLANTTSGSSEYTVWSTSIFLRTGDRTPEDLGYLPTTLTSLGAQQAYSAGAFFRDRYTSSVYTSTGVMTAPLQYLSAYSIDPTQLYAIALDEQYSVASAQAFLQGLYPPYTLNDSMAALLDPSSLLANGTYVSAAGSCRLESALSEVS